MADEPNTQSKPVVESFQLDHTKVKAPYVRYIDTETDPNGPALGAAERERDSDGWAAYD